MTHEEFKKQLDAWEFNTKAMIYHIKQPDALVSALEEAPYVGMMQLISHLRECLEILEQKDDRLEKILGQMDMVGDHPIEVTLFAKEALKLQPRFLSEGEK